MTPLNIIKKSPMVYAGGKFFYIKQYREIFKELDYDHFVDCFGGSGTMSLNFNRSGIGYLNELDPKIHYVHYNIKNNYLEFVRIFNRYTKLFVDKSISFISAYLNIIINKLDIKSVELSVILVILSKISFGGKIPFSKVNQKFLRMNINRSKLCNTVLLYSKTLRLVNSFHESLKNIEVFNLDYKDFVI